MHYTGQVYRPPMESDTPLLEITAGCSQNRCAFCTMYDRTPFRASPLEDIKADLVEMRNTLGEDVRRIFLLNGDPFALSANRLLKMKENMIAYLERKRALLPDAFLKSTMQRGQL